MTLELKIVSVNVGRARTIGERDGAPLVSAFVKKPVHAETVAVGSTGLVGDEQVDLAAHGGPERAVYAYPTDNWSWWQHEHRFACAPGCFAENLTISGADESSVAIGDRFRWGDVVLEVSQPRTPCHKFQRVSGRSDASALMTRSGRCGWHFRVIEPGVAPAGGMLRRAGESGGPSVREVFLAGADRRTARSLRERLADAPGLSPNWRSKLLGGEG